MIKFHLSMMGKLIHSHILLNKSIFNSNNLVEISDGMSQRVKTSAHELVLPRSSPPENGHLRKNKQLFHC
jgi:hypothetical protein